MAQPVTYTCSGSSIYATTTSDPMTTANWSAAVGSSNGQNQITVTCNYGPTSGSATAQATIPWGSTTPVTIAGSSSGVTLDGSVAASYTDGSAVITFTGVVVQANVVSIGCGGGALVAACLADGPGNS